LAEVSLDKVVKRYGSVEVVHGIDLHIAHNEFVVLVGPSGCGKSTTLRMIAGLEEISGGTIRIGEKIVNGLPPRARNISMVFQNYALYPHMTVEENLGFGLKIAGTEATEIRRRVKEAALVLGLDPYMDRYPANLSGGQRQRVAMGRAIVRDPQVFLFDEPLSNLDAKLRGQMRVEIKKLHRRVGTTVVYVTHDQVEAMTLADRIVIMRDGYIEQVGTPTEVFERPANTFVASFIGSPAMNLVEATVGDGQVAFAGWELPLEPARRPARAGRVILGIRPESFEDAALADAGLPAVEVEVVVVEELGSDSHVIFPIDAPRVEAEELRAAADHEDDALLADDRSLWNARVSSKTDAEPGQRLRLAVDPGALYFFDPDSGASLTVGARATAAAV
jgi:multiple sugar transport system ATP-binding protein